MGRQFPPKDKGVSAGIYTGQGEVLIRMRFSGGGKRERARKKRYWAAAIRKRMGPHLLGFGEEGIESGVGRCLRRRREGVAVAESLSGGLLAKRLTDPAGASKYFKGGVIVYSDEMKERHLGIDRKTLRHHTAVSVPVARRMAVAVRKLYGATWGIGTTGVAGPSDGGTGLPSGTVYIALASSRGCSVKKAVFRGDRERVRWMTSQEALILLWEKITDGKG